MKKQLFLAIAASAALVGCVKNEPNVKGDGSPAPITFDAPVVNIPTKATEIVSNYPTDKDFAVFALYYSGGTYTNYAEGVVYMDDVTCTKQDANNYWAPAKNYYWPKNGTLTFGAYAPSTVDAVWDAQGFKFDNFTVKENAAEQFDLLYSGRVFDQTKANNVTSEPYDGITILFKHALSSINFMVKHDDTDYTADGYTLKITKITVKNVYGAGSFAQGLKDEKEATPTEDAKWTVSGDATNYVVFDGTTTAYTLTNTPAYINGAVDANNGTRRSDLILMPQVLKQEGADAGVTVEIQYNIEHTVEGNTTVIAQTATVDLSSGFKENNAADHTAWEMGKRYTYTITVGLDKIYFNPTVQDWTDITVTPELQ